MQGKNKVIFKRYLENKLIKIVKKKQSCFIFGPRQTGKTFLVNHALRLLKKKTTYPLQNPSIRLKIEADPGVLIRQTEALPYNPVVFVDEAQKVPLIFDAAQYLIDQKRANFIFTGSSARKLRRKGVNLLPGRVKRYYLDPLLWGELGFIKENLIKPLAIKNLNHQNFYHFEDLLVYGALPAIVMTPEGERGEFLKSYSEIYLEEEIRAEALVRKIGSFSRFLELAANESGSSPNLSKLSKESGVSLPAIKEFYQVLVDTLVIHRIDPYLKNARKRIFTSPRFYFFDLGVRNALARLPLTKETIFAQKGILFEHAVILEILGRIRALGKDYRVFYWRTSAGAEVDCIVDIGSELIPIEIKASSTVTLSEIKGLRIFLEDYKNLVKRGYVITMGEREERLTENIIAIPWFKL